MKMTCLKRHRLFVLLAVFVLLASVVAGCATTEATDKPAPTVSMDKLADDYFNNMPENLYKITPEELKAHVDANDPSILIIDIRMPEDYNQGHIKGAVNIPLDEMGKYLDKFPADKEIIVACYTGQTAGQAVAVLNIYGYNARSLHLGTEKGWVGTAHYPLDTAGVLLPADVTPAKAPSQEIAQKCADYFNNMPPNLNKIDAVQLKAKIDAQEDLQIVSIRNVQDYVKGDIPGAINIPFKEINQNLNQISQDKPVIISCYTGQTAGQTVALLKLLGYDALSLSSGFDLSWRAGGFPVVVPE